ncbi:MAG: hypothetical protein ABII88_04515 [Candidatus Omnitrophota bacterium]
MANLLENLQLDKHKKMIIAAVVAVVFIVLFERLFIADLRKQSKNISNQIRIEEVRLREDLGFMEAKDQLFSDYEKCKPFFATEGLGEKDIKAQLLREVENIVRASGGSVVNLTPQEAGEKGDDQFMFYKANVQVDLTLEQLLKFFDNIQESKMLIKLDKFSVAAKDNKSDILKMDGIISIAIPS